MAIPNRCFLAVAVCGAMVLGATSVRAEYPDRPVHLVIGQATGGGTDYAARLIAAALSEKWGQPVIVENKPGADGVIASGMVARSEPDGYTLNYINALHAVTPSLQQLNYDPIKSFVPITQIMSQPNVLVVNPKVLPVNSVKELIDYAKANPGKLSHGSAGAASPAALELRLLSKMTGIDIVDVPFSGGGPALTALLGGELQLTFSSIVGSLPHIQSGALKALAVTSRDRVPLLPDVPTMEEAGNLTGYDFGTWNGLLAPAGTPDAIVRKLHDDLVAVMSTKEMQEKFNSGGMIVKTSATPEDFTKFLIEQIGMGKELLSSQQ